MFTVRFAGKDTPVADLPSLAGMVRTGEIPPEAAVFDHSCCEWTTAAAITAPPGAPEPEDGAPLTLLTRPRAVALPAAAAQAPVRAPTPIFAPRPVAAPLPASRVAKKIDAVSPVVNWAIFGLLIFGGFVIFVTGHLLAAIVAMLAAAAFCPPLLGAVGKEHPQLAGWRPRIAAAAALLIVAAIAGASRGQAVDLAKAAMHTLGCGIGHAKSCHSVGVMYEHGDGVAKDLGKAAALQAKACDGGYTGGCINLGAMHQTGAGVAKDLGKAAGLYAKAFGGAAATGCFNLGEKYYNGDGVSVDLPMAAALFATACDGGEANGCYDLGVMHRNGQGVPKDRAKAATLYKKACDGGFSDGCLQLGAMYVFGEGAPKDRKRLGDGSPRVSTAARVGYSMMRIPAGKFLMGSPGREPGRVADETQHLVTIGKDFLLGATTVTQRQWRKIMATNRSFFTSCGDDCPAEGVSWYEALDFCNRLSDLEGLTRCYSRTPDDEIHWDRICTGYRLPTEAEWEYAARAGSAAPYNTGQCLSAHQANYDGEYPQPGCPKGQAREAPVRVGSFAPNAWGLYDMHGNVWEWVWDGMAAYPHGLAIDPTGPDDGSERVLRGGGWNSVAQFCRSAVRFGVDPGSRFSDLGFRLAKSLPETEAAPMVAKAALPNKE
jgi:formylglycine-generating enzyme required for sulfatase activity/TPR repeat protein